MAYDSDLNCDEELKSFFKFELLNDAFRSYGFFFFANLDALGFFFCSSKTPIKGSYSQSTHKKTHPQTHTESS